MLTPLASQAAPNPARVLIVYYTRTGNTKAVAEHIHAQVGGDLLEIQPVTPYPTDYKATTDQAKKELAEGFKPPLSTTVPDLKAYDTIFLGSPNWWSTIAPPMMTFLSEHDMSGKTLVPFLTHGGSALGRSVTDIKTLCPTANVLDGLAVYGTNAANSQEAVATWLRSQGLAN